MTMIASKIINAYREEPGLFITHQETPDQEIISWGVTETGDVVPLVFRQDGRLIPFEPGTYGPFENFPKNGYRLRFDPRS